MPDIERFKKLKVGDEVWEARNEDRTRFSKANVTKVGRSYVYTKRGRYGFAGVDTNATTGHGARIETLEVYAEKYRGQLAMQQLRIRGIMFTTLAPDTEYVKDVYETLAPLFAKRGDPVLPYEELH